MNRLQGKAAIITGGALGIGEATCRIFASEGATVAITDILEHEGQKLAGEINASGGKAHFWRLDVSREPEVEDVFRQVQQSFGKIDALVNNAGISGVNKPTDAITEAEWDHLMNINVKGVFFCTKHAVPYMKSKGGSIINLSSIYGIIGAGDAPPYHASKGAVRLMTKNDAILYAPAKIRVNSVHPGFIWTPMVEKFAEETGAGTEVVRRQLVAKHPIGTLGEVDDVAWGIVYLASDEAKFVTGSELVIDGGYTAQ